MAGRRSCGWLAPRCRVRDVANSTTRRQLATQSRRVIADIQTPVTRFEPNVSLLIYGFYGSGGTLKAYNNLIIDVTSGYLPWDGMYLDSMTAEVVNNTIYFGAASDRFSPFRGVVANGAGLTTLRGNIIAVRANVTVGNCNASVIGLEATGGAGSTVFVSYCDLLGTNLCGGSWPMAVYQGVVPPLVNSLIQVDPRLASDGTLLGSSPCINAGPPEAIYNNRDGTRNTMGYTGGPYWNPANYTNNNPMVFLLTGQQVVLNGAQTNIVVNAAASAGH